MGAGSGSWTCGLCGESGLGVGALRRHHARCQPYQEWLRGLLREAELLRAARDAARANGHTGTGSRPLGRPTPRRL